MNKQLLALLGAIFLLAQICPALAQSAQSTRRVRYVYPANQANQSGLPNTQPTYIPEGSISRTATGRDRFGLPNTIHSPYVGRPGDGVSAGQFNNGAGGGQASGGTRNGLPLVRNSPYMAGPGDSIRSDMNHRIDGSVVPQRRLVRVQQAPQAQLQTDVYHYGTYGTPAYKRSQ